VICTCQEPPWPYLWQPNPAFEQWVERHAVELCADAHEADARPCIDHLHQARQVGVWRAGAADVVTS
jgi:hypothetical protein